jgi:hypothetical protein
VYANLGTLVIAGSPSIAVNTGVSTTLTRENVSIESGDRTYGGLDFSAPDGTKLVELSIYRETQLTLTRMAAPRFGWSNGPYELGIFLHRGGTRVQVREGLPRPVSLLVATPHGQIGITGPGSFVIEVGSSETSVSVLAGQAVIACPADQGVGYVVQSQVFPRGLLIKDKGCDRDPSPIRNLIANGDFVRDLTGTWAPEARSAGGEPTNGTISTPAIDGRNAIQFRRDQPDWGLTLIRQTIDYNIVDKRRVELQMDVRIDEHDVDACGSQGTECPIMLKIYFENPAGDDQQWLQGFYAVDDPNNPGLPSCPGCSELRDPEWYKVSGFGIWQTFSTGNLIEQMKSAGFTPGTINQIEIYASGHSFTSYVADVRLLIED